MKNNDSAVTGIPAGLIACRLNGRPLHISSISENGLTLRLASMEDACGTLEVCFRQESGKWNRVSIHDYQTGPAHCDACGVLIRFSFFDADYAADFRRSMAFYADYIRAFAEDDVQSLTDYPSHLDADFSDAFDFSNLRLPPDKEICISLHDPRLYALCLDHSQEEFLKLYSEEKQIPQIKKIHRLYIGNGFCRQLFPDSETLSKLLAKARREAIAVTIVTSPDPRVPDELLKTYSGEMLVNDWGLLHRLRNYPQIEPLFGTLLNKRRKDPRMRYKPDLNSGLLRQSSVNSPEYRDFLRSMGIERIEFERCGYDYDVPMGKCSLHLPFYQTNTSVYCPTRALCEHGDRGYQADDGGCPRYCMNNCVRYPAHLRMLGRWNSVFAADERPMDDLPGFDRIVLNL